MNASFVHDVIAEPGEAPPGTLRARALVLLALSEPERTTHTREERARLSARHTAGARYIARQLGASEPERAPGVDTLLSFEGAEGVGLARRAFQAAQLLRERVLVDLGWSARLAVHAAVLPERRAEAEAVERELHAECMRLLESVPEGRIAVSLEASLALAEAEQQQLSPFGALGERSPRAALFPAASPREEPLVRKSAETWLEMRLRGHFRTHPEVRRLRYVGLRLQKREPPSLDLLDVLVVPTVLERSPLKPVSELLGQQPVQLLRGLGQGEELRRLEQANALKPVQERSVPFPEAFRRHRALVVLGDPGSGKTTLLKWLAVVAAGGPLSLHAALGVAEPLLPLLVSVGRLAKLHEEGDSPLLDTLAHYLHERWGELDLETLRGQLERWLEQSRCLVLLDGLDEVRGESRETVRRLLEAFAARYPGNRFVASSRQVGYMGLTLPGGTEVELGPFNDEQVRRYVQAFQRAYRRWEDMADDPAADRQAEHLLALLQTNPRLHELSRNPFLLSSLALIHRAEGTLPRHRVQAYEIFARTLCETWGQARRLVAGDTHDEQLRYEEEAVPVLGRLAREMHRQWPAGVAPESFVVRVLTQVLREREESTEAEAEQAAREFLRRAGQEVQVLLERGAGQWGFLHLTFQEFFAAVGLHAAEAFEEEALAHLFNPRWEEVLRLGVGYMALVQKRAEGTRRFVVKVLEREEPGERRYMTQLLRLQVRLAALLATEAGDALPTALQTRIAEAFCDWLCAMPEQVGKTSFEEVRLTEFAARLVSPLVRLSGASEATTRGRAVHYLSRLEGPEARRVVLSALQDESSTVREAAISAVERLSLTQARDGLRQLLLDPDQMIRIGAASALLSIDPEQAEHVLSTLENQPLDEAFLSFLTVLPMLVINESTYEQVRKLIAKKSKAGDLKQRLGAAALDVFAFKFRTQHPYSSRAHEPAEQPVTFWGRRFASFLEEPDKAGSWISRMLKRFSPQRAKSLPSTLSFKDDERSALELSRLDLPHLQLAGARTLLKQGHPEGLRTLSALLKSEDANIRGLALVSLQETPVTEALLESFLGASHDPDARVRSEAAEALGARGGSGVTERLVELVRDPDETVRVAAIESLGRIQEHQAIEPLQRRLDSGASAAERDAILTALWSISSASPA